MGPLLVNLLLVFLLTLLFIHFAIEKLKATTYCPASTIFTRWRQLFFPIAFGQ
jgi:hypothetical protein